MHLQEQCHEQSRDNEVGSGEDTMFPLVKPFAVGGILQLTYGWCVGISRREAGNCHRRSITMARGSIDGGS